MIDEIQRNFELGGHKASDVAAKTVEEGIARIELSREEAFVKVNVSTTASDIGSHFQRSVSLQNIQI